jgi:hypothetical protein
VSPCNNAANCLTKDFTTVVFDFDIINLIYLFNLV